MLQGLDDSPRPIMYAALERVLDDAGVPSEYLTAFRAS
jgi:hypothetical protein